MQDLNPALWLGHSKCIIFEWMFLEPLRGSSFCCMTHVWLTLNFSTREQDSWVHHFEPVAQVQKQQRKPRSSYWHHRVWQWVIFMKCWDAHPPKMLILSHLSMEYFSKSLGIIGFFLAAISVLFSNHWLLPEIAPFPSRLFFFFFFNWGIMTLTAVYWNPKAIDMGS